MGPPPRRRIKFWGLYRVLAKDGDSYAWLHSESVGPLARHGFRVSWPHERLELQFCNVRRRVTKRVEPRSTHAVRCIPAERSSVMVRRSRSLRIRTIRRDVDQKPNCVRYVLTGSRGSPINPDQMETVPTPLPIAQASDASSSVIIAPNSSNVTESSNERPSRARASASACPRLSASRAIAWSQHVGRLLRRSSLRTDTERRIWLRLSHSCAQYYTIRVSTPRQRVLNTRFV